MSDTRLQILEMLALPRVFAVDSIVSGDCPNHARFDAADAQCARCQHGPECEWLASSEPFVDLALRPDEDLVESLRFAVDYIEANNHRARSRIATCACDSCRWLQRAQRLLREADGRAIRAAMS